MCRALRISSSGIERKNATVGVPPPPWLRHLISTYLYACAGAIDPFGSRKVYLNFKTLYSSFAWLLPCLSQIWRIRSRLSPNCRDSDSRVLPALRCMYISRFRFSTCIPSRYHIYRSGTLESQDKLFLLRPLPSGWGLLPPIPFAPSFCKNSDEEGEHQRHVVLLRRIYEPYNSVNQLVEFRPHSKQVCG